MVAGLPLEGIDLRFKDFVDRVARGHLPMAMHLDNAHMTRVENNVVTVFFTRELHEKAIKGAVDSPAITGALADAFGAGTKLMIVAAPAEPSSSSPSIAEARDRALADAQSALEAHAQSRPVVEKAVALFGGSVRAVRGQRCGRTP